MTGRDFQIAEVSIPFNREGVSEHATSWMERLKAMLFLFPSTGKAFLNGNRNGEIA